MVKNNTVSDIGIQAHQKVALPAHVHIYIASPPTRRSAGGWGWGGGVGELIYKQFLNYAMVPFLKLLGNPTFT
jgi:hypothetical protein